jgi:hypothetical protein
MFTIQGLASKMPNIKAALAGTILVLALFAESNSAFAIDLRKAGASLQKLLLSNYLFDSYKKSECNVYVSKEQIDRHINSNNEKIAKIQNQLDKRSQEEFRSIVTNQQLKQNFDSAVKTYIYDAIKNRKTGFGGIAFACGFAYGHVFDLMVDAWKSDHIYCDFY